MSYLISEKGFSTLDSKDNPFWDPEAAQEFIDVFVVNFIETENRRLTKSPHYINSPEFFHQFLNLHKEIITII
ncbi:Tm-1-like ATP-binding domain-containing protein [Xenorhabdus sp. Vera]|uniref:Tm-1-like ATP-binding domain-containing protein n=1 Tax=Xenorhabdus koppenhoeferi TaxID=351659 RepID=UPI0019B8DFC4|nr:Tm-1-like ATP-binding domain-containing protein [Xenorhabdus sp. Vera]